MLFLISLATCFSFVKGESDFISMPHMVTRLNWGVVFQKSAAPLLNGFQLHKHTVAIAKPNLEYIPLQKMECNEDKKEQILVHCKSINSLIENINNGFRNDFKVLKTDFDTVFQIVPAFKETFPKQKKEKKRKKRNVSSDGSLSEIRDGIFSDDAPSLGPDFCEKKSGEVQVDDGFWHAVGVGMSLLMDTPSWETLQATARTTCKMADMSGAISDQIMDDNKEMKTMAFNFNHFMGGLEDMGKNLDYDITLAQNQLLNASKTLGEELDNVTARIRNAETVLARIIFIQGHLRQFQLAQWKRIKDAENFMEAFYTLLDGYLSPFFLSNTDIEEVLDHVRKNVLTKHKILNIIYPSPAFYYQYKNILFSHGQHYLIITLNIPLSEAGGLLTLYKIDNTHIRTAEHHNSSYKIANLPDFLAVTPYGQGVKQYYSEMSLKDVMSCVGENIKTCKTQRSLQPIDTQTCTVALFTDKTNEIMKRCDLRYEGKDRETDVVAIDFDKYLVHVEKGSFSSQKWPMKCNGTKSELKTCNTCVITVPCGCSVEIDNFIILPRIAGCHLDGGKDTIKTRFPISMASTYYILDYDMKYILNGSSEYQKEHDKGYALDKLIINVTGSDWEQAVDLDDDFSKNYTKALGLINESSQIFGTKVEQMKQEALKSHENNIFHLRDFKRMVNKNFVQYFTKHNVLLFVTNFWVLTTLTTIMTIYNCFTIHKKN